MIAKQAAGPARSVPRLVAESFVDSSVFLGMHAADDALRRSCKAFFVSMLGRPLAMGFEEVARCDDVIWSKPRHVQDAYYPFMDRLQSDGAIRRLPLRLVEVDVARGDRRLAPLADRDRLTVAMALFAATGMTSVNPRLLALPELPVVAPPHACHEALFPDEIEALYERSLLLRLPMEDVVG